MKASLSPYAVSATRSNPVVVRPVDDDLAKREFDQQLDEFHYLGGDCQGGDYLRQTAYLDGEPVALLAWGASCYRLKPRDEHIGWNPTVRAERQKLIVQNRRYLLLVEPGERPNLASQVLGAALRVLGDQWIERFGYRPLGAETFSDIEAFAGTCYQATGWTPLGETKGFSRHRMDFFHPHGHPKKLWFKYLHPHARRMLLADRLAPDYEQGGKSSARGVWPMPVAEIDQLFAALLKVPDPRTKNRTFLLASMLSVIVLAQLCGRVDISSIVRFGQGLTQKQRTRLGLPYKKSTNFRMVPGYKAYWGLLKQLDPEALGRVLSDWLGARAGPLPGDLAMDGKMTGTIAGVVSLVDVETGVARATAPMRHKEDGPDGELTCAAAMIKRAGPLDGQTISSDALHTQRELAVNIVEQGGEFIQQVKGNQPSLQKQVRSRAKSTPLFRSNRTESTDAS